MNNLVNHAVNQPRNLILCSTSCLSHVGIGEDLCFAALPHQPLSCMFHKVVLDTSYCFRCWLQKNLKTFKSEEALKLQAVMLKNPRRSRPSQKGRSRRPDAAAATQASEENIPESPETPTVAVWEVIDSDDESPTDSPPGAACFFRGM